MQRLEEQAARHWGFAPDQIRMAAQRENIVWRAEDASGAYALRLHRQGYRSHAALMSELHWMDALVQGGLSVPRPVPSCNGRLVEQVEGTLVDVLTWLPGQPIGVQGQLDVTDRTGLCRDLGSCWHVCMRSATHGRRHRAFRAPYGTVQGCSGTARSGGRSGTIRGWDLTSASPCWLFATSRGCICHR